MTADGGPGPPAPGDMLIRSSWWGTVVFTATALAAVFLDGPADLVAFVVAVGLFAVGVALFAWSYAAAAERSRTHELSVAGLYFLAGGSAPRDVRRRLLGSLAVQVVVSLATAIAKPYTSLAAGTLVPMYGLALCGLWAARYGTFPKRLRRNEGPKAKP